MIFYVYVKVMLSIYDVANCQLSVKLLYGSEILYYIYLCIYFVKNVDRYLVIYLYKISIKILKIYTLLIYISLRQTSDTSIICKHILRSFISWIQNNFYKIFVKYKINF